MIREKTNNNHKNKYQSWYKLKKNSNELKLKKKSKHNIYQSKV